MTAREHAYHTRSPILVSLLALFVAMTLGIALVSAPAFADEVDQEAPAADESTVVEEEADAEDGPEVKADAADGDAKAVDEAPVVLTAQGYSKDWATDKDGKTQYDAVCQSDGTVDYYCEKETGNKLGGFITTNENKTYYFVDGVMHTGWRDIGSNRYYFNEQGVMQTGMQKIKGKTYFFIKKGADKGAMATGLKNVSGRWYSFDTDGVMQTGFQSAKNGYVYYYDPDNSKHPGARYVPASARLRTIDGDTYYFSINGAIARQRIKTIKGKKYYFRKNGAMFVKKAWKTFNSLGDGQYKLTNGKKGESSYFVKGGKGAYIASGLVKIGKKCYYFKPVGSKIKPTTCYAVFEEKGSYDSLVATQKQIEKNKKKIDKEVAAAKKTTGYLFTVDRDRCFTNVFKYNKKQDLWMPLKSFRCSVGAHGGKLTPAGITTIKRKAWWSGVSETGAAEYWLVEYRRHTNGEWGWSFHSILYRGRTYNVYDGRIGKHCSNGCVRNVWRNAEWIYKHAVNEKKKIYSPCLVF